MACLAALFDRTGGPRATRRATGGPSSFCLNSINGFCCYYYYCYYHHYMFDYYIYIYIYIHTYMYTYIYIYMYIYIYICREREREREGLAPLEERRGAPALRAEFHLSGVFSKGLSTFLWTFSGFSQWIFPMDFIFVKSGV